VVNSRVQFGAFTYDLNRKTLQPLFADFQPPQGGYIWNSTTQQGIVGTSGSYGTYYWLTPYGTEPLTLTLQNNTTRWTMSDSVRALREYETSHAAFERYSKAHPVGEAGDMDWAWATAQLAFYASLAPIGRSYSPLARIPWDLYVVDIRSQVIQRIHTTRGDAGSLRWSSDGQWLAYTTPGDGWGQPGGVYLWSLQTRQTYRVHTGSYGSIAWSPDNTHIAAIQEGKELWIYDVRQIVTTAEAPSTRVHRVCCSVYSVGAPAQQALAADRLRRARS